MEDELAILTRRNLALGALAAATVAALTNNSRASGVEADAFRLVDPELLPAARTLKTTVVNRQNLNQARAGFVPPVRPAPFPQPRATMIPGPSGAPDVRVVIVDGTQGKAGSPAFLHMHGGGFVMGSIASNVPRLQELAQACGCLAISVDYRLAPETPFPGALEDNYAALRWLNRHAKDMGVDPMRVAVGGESAGGGHAAMLAIAARDRGEFHIAFQRLIYPMLDDRTGSTRHEPPFIGQFVWNEASNRFGWASLLGRAPGRAHPPYGSVPARVKDLAGLPPAFIAVGDIDLFVAEDIDYASRLVQAGVPTELTLTPGAFHAFDDIVPAAAATVRFHNAALRALKAGLGVV